MTSRQKDLFGRAQSVFPGGVNSPARLAPPEPLFAERGSGAQLIDVDGRSLLDYNLAFGALILGHAHPAVVRAIRRQAGRGTLFGVCNPLEVNLAERVTQLVPSMERIRFASTGTEAAMHALRLARAATNRSLIVKMDGAFHGSSDSCLVGAGSAAENLSLPNSAGVLPETAAQTRVLPFNDPDALEKTLAGETVAAVIVEPVMTNLGTIPPRRHYLQAVRNLTREYGALLIFDEVVTGFRLTPGGAQALYRVTPDLTLLGKILGGGLPVGAFGGRADLLDRVAPVGDVYQAGTFNGNPLSMAAGLATLGRLTPTASNDLFRRGETLQGALHDVLQDRKAGIVQGVGPVFQIFLGLDVPVHTATQARAADAHRYKQLYQALVEKGILFPPNQWESGFLSLAHQPDDLTRTAEAVDACLASA